MNKNAQQLSTDEVKNKLRTLYKGTKNENLIYRIASTFTALCEYGDFSAPAPAPEVAREKSAADSEKQAAAKDADAGKPPALLKLDSLQYNLNIILPESRDQAVYDAIFKSLRDHLGPGK